MGEDFIIAFLLSSFLKIILRGCDGIKLGFNFNFREYFYPVKIQQILSHQTQK